MRKGSPKKSKNSYWAFPDMSKAIEIGLYYGFNPTNAPSIEKSDRDHAKSLSASELRTTLSQTAEERTALLRTYFSKGIPPLPLNVVYARSFHERKDPKHIEYCYEIVGAPKSIADATIIKAAYEAVRADGYEDINVEINTLGDRESFSRYSRDLTVYYRRHLGDLHPDCRHLFKKNVFAGVMCCHEKCTPIKDHAPRPINYLSESARIHFKEILEFLEIASIPYTLNDLLIENPEFVCHTVFRIHGTEPGKKDCQLLAAGCRWAGMAKRVGIKKDVPGVTAVVSMKKKSDNKTPKKIKKPIFYFVQMGQEAKLKSLDLIEKLRRVHIPIYHALTKDKLTAQLSTAEHLRTPYLLIMGQKESLENTVLVRNTEDSSQETIRITEIADYLKKISH